MMRKTLSGLLKRAISQTLQVDDVPEYFTTIESKTANGKPMIGIFNTVFKDAVIQSRFHWCVTMCIHLNPFELDKNGLPYDHEARMAHRMERLHVITMGGRTPSYHIGHLFRNGVFEIWWYVRNPQKARSYMHQESSRDEMPRKISFDIRHDPRWQIVKPFLTLCEDDWAYAHKKN